MTVKHMKDRVKFAEEYKHMTQVFLLKLYKNIIFLEFAKTTAGVISANLRFNK